MKDHGIKIGDTVRLVSKPDGNTSKKEPVTVGKNYICKGFDCHEIGTTSDEPGHIAFYPVKRVVKVEPSGP